MNPFASFLVVEDLQATMRRRAEAERRELARRPDAPPAIVSLASDRGPRFASLVRSVLARRPVG